MGRRFFFTFRGPWNKKKVKNHWSRRFSDEREKEKALSKKFVFRKRKSSGGNPIKEI